MTRAHAYRVNYVQELDDDQIETPCGCNSVIAERPSLLPYPKSNNFIYSQPVPKRTLQICLLSAFAVLGAVDPWADACPPAKDEIATDRLDVTNSSLVVPVGSLQSENGVNFSARDGGRTINGTNTRWPLGVAPCLELLLDLPTYFANVRGPGSSGFSNVAPARKWQVSPIPGKIGLSLVFGGSAAPAATRSILNSTVCSGVQAPVGFSVHPVEVSPVKTKLGIRRWRSDGSQRCFAIRGAALR
jgi:hypothetical protein